MLSSISRDTLLHFLDWKSKPKWLEEVTFRHANGFKSRTEPLLYPTWQQALQIARTPRGMHEERGPLTRSLGCARAFTPLTPSPEIGYPPQCNMRILNVVQKPYRCSRNDCSTSSFRAKICICNTNSSEFKRDSVSEMRDVLLTFPQICL